MGALAGDASGCRPESLDARGQPIKSGRFRLRTFPSGARVWIDGVLKIEATPATLVLEEGEYRLRIQAPGAEAIEQVIEVEAGEEKELTLNIPRPPEARITVLSDVAGAEVRINGYRRGETPLFGAITRPGPIDITIMTPTGRAKAVRADLGIGEQKTIEVQFERDEASRFGAPPRETGSTDGRGLLTLGLQPEGEVFTLEGRRLGATPIVQMPIEAGEHDLWLRSLDGRYEKKVSIEIAPGETAVFRFQFRGEDEIVRGRP